MKQTRMLLHLSVASAIVFVSASAQKLQYPATKKVEQVDIYFGTTVADPYRWLEDETVARKNQLD